MSNNLLKMRYHFEFLFIIKLNKKHALRLIRCETLSNNNDVTYVCGEGDTDVS